MTKPTGGPAFPVTINNRDTNPATGFLGEEIKPHSFSTYSGMTLRDYFAAKALAGLAANQSMIDSNDSKAVRYLADCSYQIADAMLIARVKP
ncbi:hypothetical protein CCOS865_02191 [Pseudomonas reidholzensis]|uniref:Uncharacterized protein n=1 Tax=Pseudomonas reidholzensis TaxID=1785162 RepID=A0A383RSS0_9PSED|nr:hypothetical protein [Pseudomonas reidholzensis]SYX89925.1 hypothetical protein CCOS865_02191 [Pseudomonas reidholzensis]